MARDLEILSDWYDRYLSLVTPALSRPPCHARSCISLSRDGISRIWNYVSCIFLLVICVVLFYFVLLQLDWT